MKTRLAIRLAAAARRAAGRIADRSLILLYHRVAETSPDPWSLAVTPRHFSEHLDVLRRHALPIAMRDLAAAHQRGRVPSAAVAVTFDDGYADNLHAALPLLERQEIPATVFVTSGFIGARREFWWDELEALLLQPGELPETLWLVVGEKRHEWALGDAVYTPAEAERDRAWTPYDPPPTARHRAYHAIWRLLQPRTPAEQRAALDSLYEQAGREPRARPGSRALISSELTALAASPLVEIGAHTVDHPVLARIAPEAQRAQVAGSRAALEEQLGAPVRGFAYPFGGPRDYGRPAVEAVRDAGFDYACAASGGATTRFSSRFQLPRLYMIDMDGDAFAELLTRELRRR
jgi:peptidoglycan/xylan/chitin deacetylase (PgdA/CDA1 family)